MRNAPFTFETKLDADAWLKAQAREVERDVWRVPDALDRAPMLRDFAEMWLAERDIKPRTRHQYRTLLDDLILPHLGDCYIDRIQPLTVRNWHAAIKATAAERARKDRTGETWVAQAYGLLRVILNSAWREDLITANPCRIEKAGRAKKAHKTRPATLAELEVIVAAMPPRYRSMVLLAAWCALRFGELAELRRRDVDLDREAGSGVVNIERGISRVDGEVIVGDPKTEAGRRRVTIPPHLVPLVAEHLDEFVADGPDALVFAARHGGHMAPATLYKVYYPAREKAGRADLRFHDLRHTGATLAAATGATIADLMARLGHTTPGAAMIYQHTAADRDQLIAEALSGFATAGKVVPGRL